MARPKGSRTVLVRITYDTIGELAGGIAGDTATDSALTWVNAPQDCDWAVDDRHS